MCYVSKERLLVLSQFPVHKRSEEITAFLNYLINAECKELPEEELRPMADAPLEVPILVDTGKDLREAFVSKDGVVNFSDCNLFEARALGWRHIHKGEN